MTRQTKAYWVDPEIHARLKVAVALISAQGEVVTLAEIVEAAFLRQLRHLERKHNGGRPFVARER